MQFKTMPASILHFHPSSSIFQDFGSPTASCQREAGRGIDGLIGARLKIDIFKGLASKQMEAWGFFCLVQ